MKRYSLTKAMMNNLRASIPITEIRMIAKTKGNVSPTKVGTQYIDIITIPTVRIATTTISMLKISHESVNLFILSLDIFGCG